MCIFFHMGKCACFFFDEGKCVCVFFFLTCKNECGLFLTKKMCADFY